MSVHARPDAGSHELLQNGRRSVASCRFHGRQAVQRTGGSMTFEKSPESAHRSRTSRRQVLKGLGAALLGGPALVRSAQAADSIVFVGWGGALQKSYDAHVLQPIAKKLGVQLINAYGPDLAKLKAQVLVNKVEWDFLSTTGAMAMG